MKRKLDPEDCEKKASGFEIHSLEVSRSTLRIFHDLLDGRVPFSNDEVRQHPEPEVIWNSNLRRMRFQPRSDNDRKPGKNPLEQSKFFRRKPRPQTLSG